MNLHVTPNNLPRTDILISQRVPDDFNREQLQAKTAFMARIAVKGGVEADFIREKLQAFSPEERKKILDDLIAHYEDRTNPSRDQAIADSIKKIKDKLINGEFHYPIGKPVANRYSSPTSEPVPNRYSSPTLETRQNNLPDNTHPTLKRYDRAFDWRRGISTLNFLERGDDIPNYPPLATVSFTRANFIGSRPGGGEKNQYPFPSFQIMVVDPGNPERGVYIRVTPDLTVVDACEFKTDIGGRVNVDYSSTLDFVRDLSPNDPRVTNALKLTMNWLDAYDGNYGGSSHVTIEKEDSLGSSSSLESSELGDRFR
jgi:hypothetical protein